MLVDSATPFTQQPPALEAFLLLYADDMRPPTLPRRQRFRHREEALIPADEAGVRHDFVLKVVVSYCNGSTQQQIATMFGVQVHTIRTTLRDAGVKLGERNTTFGDDELQTIRRLHVDGVSVRWLRRRHSVAHTTILRRLR